MNSIRVYSSVMFACFCAGLGGQYVRAQQEISSLEKFALAVDRGQPLAELIPGTEEYYFLNVLHFQNTRQFDKAQAMLVEWKTKLGDNQRLQNISLRQALLTYESNPQQTLNTLREQLSIQLNHAAPSKNLSATLPTSLDNAALDVAALLEALIARDRSLTLIETDALHLVLDRQLAADQLRTILGRLQRADLPGLVKRIAEELAMTDSRGFGWASVHQQLTLPQLDELAILRPELLGNDSFVRAYTQRLAPAEGNSLSDPVELRNYLDRLLSWTKRLPATQNNLKAQVLGNLLKLNMQQGNYDRGLFVEYLSLPRPTTYYIRQLTENVPTIDLAFRLEPQLLLPAVGNDEALVRRYLEHFLASNDKLTDVAKFVNQEFLQRVLAEIRILNGIGDSATWYAKLTADSQRELRDRIELKFAPENVSRYEVDQPVQLQVELKNVPQLLVKIYQINTLAYFRSHGSWVKSDLDLDGLVPNREQLLDYQQPSDRRHRETIALPELNGRGVWVVDLIGGGERSRALIEKGRLLALQRIGSAGHVIQIVDEAGQPVPEAQVELAGQEFKPNEKGQILVPYAETSTVREAVLVHGEFASPLSLMHLQETYALSAKFLVDRQSLVAGTRAKLLLQTQLTCNGQPTSLKLLEDAELAITAVDLDGISTRHVVNKPELIDNVEFSHLFLVPQRLASLSFSLQGKVHNQVRDVKEAVSASFDIACNNIHRSSQIGDFFLQPTPAGYRLAVRGKNGEPLANLPISLRAKLRQFTEPQTMSLATNTHGHVELGLLKDVRWIQVEATGLQPISFELRDLWRSWPAQLQVGLNASIELALGSNQDELANFELIEIRQQSPVRLHNDRLSIEDSLLTIAPLPSGDFRLLDRRMGQTVSIRVADVPAQEYSGVGAYSVGKHRVLQQDRHQQVSIQSATINDNKLRVQIAGGDQATRIHLLALPYSDPAGLAGLFSVTNAPAYSQGRIAARNLYQDSLKIDEEYRYILDRQRMKTYPGNMLPQPSLLIHPWEVSVTQNQIQDAKAGDPMSAAPPAPAAMAPKSDERFAATAGNDPGWKSYDFLRFPAVLLDNQVAKDGILEVPIQQMVGYSHLIVQVMNGTTTDCRQVVLPVSEVASRDGRLEESFEANKSLAQTQKIQIIAGGEKVNFGDARSRRIRAYTSIAELYQFYSSLLNNPTWEEFRFLTRWAEMTAEQKKEIYNEKACHELNFFLYHKDPEFFQSVIKPFIAQKLDKQLVDRWLLGESLEQFTPLWYQPRLNTLERILLAQKIPSQQVSVSRWLKDYAEAHPIDSRSRQVRFETGKTVLGLAMRTEELESLGRLDASDKNSRLAESEYFFGSTANAPGDSPAKEMAENRAKQLSKDSFSADGDVTLELRRLGGSPRRFFQSLDKTREWAETQYHHVRLNQQTAQLVPPNPFWLAYLAAGSPVVLNEHIDLPCTTIHDALCALAVIDLPLAADAPQTTIEENLLYLQTDKPAVVFVESIDSIRQAEGKPAIMVGHEIYLAQPAVANSDVKSVNDQALLRGVPYRASIVLSNPTDKVRRIQVLAQLPAGSMPLAGSKFTRSTPVDLQPYSTSQIAYEFYFPSAGQFEHYGIQVSEGGENISHSKSSTIKVLDEPESLDQTTWTYVADWGTNDQVLEFLKSANLQSIDLSRIAFRMQDTNFFKSTTEYLATVGSFEPTLWGYSVLHNSPIQIQTLLQQRTDLTNRLGPIFQSALVSLEPRLQLSYEHLDYKPLVVARAHQLGAKRTILNSGLFTQYHRVLDLLAHQPQPNNDQRLQLCYYMLLQNRLEDAIRWFESVDATQLNTQLQYDYFAAYIDFYRGEYEAADRIALKYVSHPVPRWQQLFAQVRGQIAQRTALLSGEALDATAIANADTVDQRLLVGGREATQAASAEAQASINLDQNGGRVLIAAKNVPQVQVKYYLMDIELLFSRNPFVVQGNNTVPVIKPNLTDTIEIAGKQLVELNLPKAIRNRNVLIEVTGGGQSQTTVVTANSLAVTVAETQGLLQVRAAEGKLPVTAAYVKVYAQHQDGSTRFFKDGYTDLRGQFDYATLSTGELDTSTRFAILIVHPEFGAVVREVKTPAR